MVENGVNNFLLSELAQDVPTLYDTYAAIFPGEKREGHIVLISDRRLKKDKTEMYLDIQRLKIPDRVKSLGIRDSPQLEEGLIKIMRDFGMPFIALACGKQIDTEIEAISLYTIAGISPQRALNRLKHLSNKRLRGE